MTEQEKAEHTNNFYNSIAEELSDWDGEELYGYGGKRIPYIGWFWRWCDFANKQITIGECGPFIGVMESNKWGYDERNMTPEEADMFMLFLARAKARTNTRGDVDAVLRRMWDWFQTLNVHLLTPEEETGGSVGTGEGTGDA